LWQKSGIFICAVGLREAMGTAALAVFAQKCGFRLDFITYDMTENSLPDNIITEHEKMFMDEGIKIKGLIATYTEE
jgi:hypothetical protein